MIHAPASSLFSLEQKQTEKHPRWFNWSVMTHYTHRNALRCFPSLLIIKRSPKVNWGSISVVQLQGTFSFHFWFVTSSAIRPCKVFSDLRITHHLQEKGNKASQKRVYYQFRTSKARLETDEIVAQVSVPQKLSLGNSTAATLPVNAAFIFHSPKGWQQKAIYCSLGQGCWTGPHRTSTISGVWKIIIKVYFHTTALNSAPKSF